MIVPWLLRKVERMEGKGSLLVVVLGLMLLCAFISAECGLAPIVGAFLFGMVVGSSKESRIIEEEVEPIFLFLAPVFFVMIGLTFNVGKVISAWQFALILTIGAVVSKLVGAGAFAKIFKASHVEASIIGLGMVPRGEVGLIVANIGMTAGVINAEIFAGSVAMCILTIVVVPPLLRPLGKKYQAELAVETGNKEEPVSA
jgi:Kef-type K+ transport system membrane component KefB